MVSQITWVLDWRAVQALLHG